MEHEPMKQGRTLIDLAKELTRQKETKKDYLAPTSKVRMSEAVTDETTGEVGPVLELNGSGAFGINALGHRQIGEWAKIPSKYYDRMRTEAPSLLVDNVNAWLRKSEDVRMVRTLDGDVRAFLSNSYRPLDNFDLAEAVLPILQGGDLGITVRSCEVTPSRLYLKATAKNITSPIKGSRRVGDVVEAGICLSNSEVGHGSLRIEGLLYFLACLNGMIAPESSMRKYHVGRRQMADVEIPVELLRDETRRADDRAFWLKVQDAVRASFDDVRFQSLVRAVESGVERKIEKPVDQVIEVVAKRNGLSDQEGSGILNYLAAGGDLTQYGLGNAITAFSKKARDYERATELERMGGDVLLLPQSSWKEIGAAA